MGQKNFARKITGVLYPKSRELERRWWFYYWQEMADGKQVRSRHYVPMYETAAEREGYVLQMIRDFREKGVPPPKKGNHPREARLANVELKAIMGQHTLTQSNRRKSTNSSYKGHIERFDAWCQQGRVVRITPDIAQQYLYHLRDSGLAGNTCNAHRTTLRKYYAELVKRGKLKNNPFADTARHKVESEGAEYFRKKDVATLRAYLQEHEAAVWLCAQFQFYCFVRPREEFRKLKVADVDLDKWTLRVPAAVGKNGKYVHVVIPRPFRPSLEYLADYPGTMYLCGRDGLPSDTMIGENYTYNRHRAALEACGVPGTLYSWKHTGVVAAYQSGVGLEDLRRQLRHHSLDMTQVYLRSLGLLDLDGLSDRFPTL